MLAYCCHLRNRNSSSVYDGGNNGVVCLWATGPTLCSNISRVHKYHHHLRIFCTSSVRVHVRHSGWSVVGNVCLEYYTRNELRSVRMVVGSKLDSWHSNSITRHSLVSREKKTDTWCVSLFVYIYLYLYRNRWAKNTTYIVTNHAMSFFRSSAAGSRICAGLLSRK